MAYYKLTKVSRFIIDTSTYDVIEDFKEYLHMQWFEGLSEAEQKEYIRKEETKRAHAREALGFMLAMNSMYKYGHPDLF